MENTQQVVGLIVLLLLGYTVYAFARKPDIKPAGPYGATWRPFESIVLAISIFLFSNVVASLLVIQYYASKGISDLDAISAGSNVSNFVTMLIFEAITLGLILAFLKRRKARHDSIGLVKPRISNVGQALLGYGVYIAIYLIIFNLTRHLPGIDVDQKQELGFTATEDAAGQMIIFFSLVILAPIVEEIVTRGFLFTGLRSKLSWPVAAITTSLIFGAAHLQFGSGNKLLWVAGIDTFILSMVSVYLRTKTKSLIPSILLHMMKNAVAFTFLFVITA